MLQPTTIQESPGFVIWLLGPTSSGKTTIAERLLGHLREDGLSTLHYDGDEVRDFFGDSLGFGSADRLRVVSTLAHLVNKSTAAGVNVIVSALTANEDARRHIRESIPNLIICYVKCSIETCAARDPKGLYEKAQRGEIDTLIGFNAEYATPENPDIVIDTEKLDPGSAVIALVDFLRQNHQGLNP